MSEKVVQYAEAADARIAAAVRGYESQNPTRRRGAAFTSGGRPRATDGLPAATAANVILIAKPNPDYPADSDEEYVWEVSYLRPGPTP